MKTLFRAVAGISLFAFVFCFSGCGVAPAPTSSLSSGGGESTPAASGKPVEAGYQLHTITLPANQLPTGYSPGHPKEHPKLEPFNLSIQLPEIWTVEVSKELDDTYGDYLCFPVTFYENGKEVGSLSYSPVDIFDYDDPPSPDDPGFYTSLYHDLMMPEMVNWNNDYTPVAQTPTSCNATCQVDVINLDGDKPVVAIPPVYYNAILAYNLDILEYINIFFQDGQPGSKDVLTTIAKSIVLAPASGGDSESSTPSTPASSSQPASDTQTAAITFPASDEKKTQENAAAIDIPPFTFFFNCPADWEFKELASNPPTDAMMKEFGDGVGGVGPLLARIGAAFSIREIWSGDQCVGLMGYDTYEPVPGEEKNPAAILSGVAVGNDYKFTVNTTYLPIHTTDTTESAITSVNYSPSLLGTNYPRSNLGLTFYDMARHVYVVMEFAEDAVSDSQATSICQSMSIADAQPASTATD